MKHHTRCLAALGLYAVSLLCLTDCHPAPADPVEPPALTHSWGLSPTDAYQDALPSMPLSPEAELPLPETSPAAAETLPSSPTFSETPDRASFVISSSPEDSSLASKPTPSEPAPPESSAAPAIPLPSESSTSESSTTEASSEPPATETPAQPPTTEAPAEPPVTETPDEPPTTEAPAEPPVTETPFEPPTTEVPAEPPTQAPAPTPTHNRSHGQLAFQRQNELLVQNGITPLQWSESLYQIAAERAEAISTEYSHAGCPDWVGENLLRGVISPDMAVQIWYDSDGHRQNMLAGWTYGAVANYGSYWAAVFAMTENP